METNNETEYTGTATYCPEDNKLRLYVGRVPKEEYLALRAEGWTSTPKQDCDFAATWTPERRDRALAYAGIIEDEDMSPEERAADRAERFAGYREKRLDEAVGHADRYDAGPSVHGYQSKARAVRAADRHDRIAGKAVDAWDKAEYWQRRTAGVIRHALYSSSPSVRMGRIKTLESDIRKAEKRRKEYQETRERWLACAAMDDKEAQDAFAMRLAYIEHGDYIHPRTGRKSYLYDHGRHEEGRTDDPLSGAELCELWLSRHNELAPEGPWLTHYRNRLAYERQMLEAQGGRMGELEIEVGGWVLGSRTYHRKHGWRQIEKVNKSPATGRVVSVGVKMPGDRYGNSSEGWHLATITIERASPDCYRAPTEEERAAFIERQKVEKAEAKARKPKGPSLINPTDADAERLQAVWNEQNKSFRWSSDELPTVLRMTQAQYSAHSKGSFGRCETVTISGGGFRQSGAQMRGEPGCPTVAKIRACGWRVVILTDKPQKALTAEQWTDPRPAIREALAEDFERLESVLRSGSTSNWTAEEREIVRQGQMSGLVYVSSMSQFGFTAAGNVWAEAQRGTVANA